MSYLRLAGKFLISVGVGVLLFIGWTLYGTGLYTKAEQSRLAAQFADQGAPPASVRAADLVGPPPGYSPQPGAPVFRLTIPAIDADFITVEGVGADELKKGPGHFPSCRRGFEPPHCTQQSAVWPGERGRVIVSGHRTTYLHPFLDLDKLRLGDDIVIEAHWGGCDASTTGLCRFVYEVTKKEVVPAGDAEVANPKATRAREIVLTTCHPRYSASERLIVYGRMRTPPA